jgi:adenylylsulfate kinase
MIVVWFTGLPSSGKTTLAEAVRARLRECGCASLLLDGDEVRGALVPPPGYDEAGRDAFYHTLANLAALCARRGLPVLVAATGHLRRFRDRLPGVVEVHVATPAEVCRTRDAKGLWAAAPPGLPGPDDYQPPLAPAVTAEGGLDHAARDRVVDLVVRAAIAGRP